MNVLFHITSSSKCRAWQHSWGKVNTARQSNITLYTKAQLWWTHWSVSVTDYTGNGLPSVQPSRGKTYATSGCFQTAPGLTGCQTNCTLQCSYTSCFTAWKFFALPGPSICASLRIASGEYSQKWHFLLGQGGCCASPLPQPPETECRVAYIKGYAKEGDSVTAPSPNTGMTSNLKS